MQSQLTGPHSHSQPKFETIASACGLGIGLDNFIAMTRLARTSDSGAARFLSVERGTKKSKKQDIDLMCQQYVVRSGTTDFTIRQPKPDEQRLIPLNTAIQFVLDKNKMKFKVDGTSFQFVAIPSCVRSACS